MYTAINFNWEK